MKVDQGIFDVSMNTTSETGIVSSRFRIKILKSFTKVESLKTGLHLKFSYRAKPLFLYSSTYANTPGSVTSIRSSWFRELLPQVAVVRNCWWPHG